ncbi:AAA family ATPase [Aggregatilinea lenta]|uniref:AAA family ATPase n=1 Tax=Aggregatilinea lenta TaxID=913108 RepID=UPI000E5BAA8A|nr:AAA family ATPase [Aggregatilinea lenta]
MSMLNLFQPAQESQTRLRLAITGATGRGKTLTMLKVLSAMMRFKAEEEGLETVPKFAVLDTEGFSASKYKYEEGVGPFDVLPMPFTGAKYAGHHPLNYVHVIEMAGQHYAALGIDSLSHEWFGKDGSLQLVDKYTLASKSKNSYTEGWGKVTPWHTTLIETLLGSPLHICATMRSKQDYVLENNKPRKVGLGPIQRDGTDYEFDIVADMREVAVAAIDKTRCSRLRDGVFQEPGEDLARILWDWITSGEADHGLEEAQARIAAKIAEARAKAPASPATTPESHDDHTYGALLTELVTTRKAFRSKPEVDKWLAETFGGEFDAAQWDEYMAASANGVH